MTIALHDLKAQYRRLKPRIEERMQAVLEHGQYIMGPEVAELEEKLAAFTGAKHCIGVADGTTALMVALLALDIGPGVEVVTTPFTFFGTGEMIALLRAKPVFVDIDPRTYNIDPAAIEAAITPRTRAILPVSLYGQCADMDAINAVAGRHGVPVIEDGAQSFGATYKGRRSCALSTLATTSFFPTKPLGCYGDGGACFTDDDALAEKMRQIRVHGQSRRYYHPIIGINGRLDTLQAAVLLAKLETLDEELAARERIGRRYGERLQGIARAPYVEPHNRSVYAQYTIEVDWRTEVQAKLKAAGIPTAVHYPVPLHLQPAFAGLGQGEGAFPLAEAAARRVMSLPMHADLDESTQDRVAAALRDAIAVRTTA
jgi:UDP-2-acetamido-2-deoxy-ribo-hexuluronate aminotransferase